MDIKKMIERLPKALSREYEEKIYVECRDELGGQATIFQRENIVCEPELYRTMTYEDWKERERKAVHRWAARCKCTSCQEEFYAGWIKGTRHGSSVRGVCFFFGEDGTWYPGYCDREVDGWNLIEYVEGDVFECAYCGSNTRLIHKGSIRSGLTFGVQAMTVEVIDGYAVLLFWVVKRRLDPYGYYRTESRPREALVLDERGRLVRFSHTSYGQYGEGTRDSWVHMKTFLDPAQKTIYDYVSSCHRKMGISWIGPLPSLGGTTAEKTGLTEYLNADGRWPVSYLMTWQVHRQVENLLKAGWDRCVIDGIEDEWSTAHIYDGFGYNGRGELRAARLEFLDWNEVKPNRILGISKEEMKAGWNWSAGTLKVWRRFQGICSALEFDERIRMLGKDRMEDIADRFDNGEEGYSFRRLMRYIDKQKDYGQLDALEALIDCRRMAMQLGPADLTEVELWPPNLHRVHERLSRMMALEVNASDNLKYERGFRKVYEKYKTLEWTDGEFCILLPKCNGDLIMEGKKLQHCVGGYGSDHVKEKDVIFFVRRWRRPERSYYTLDIDMLKGAKQRQLHGYKNERRGEWKIPQKVLDFVERWKAEVLEPWYQNEMRRKGEKGRGKQKRVAAGTAA